MSLVLLYLELALPRQAEFQASRENQLWANPQCCMHIAKPQTSECRNTARRQAFYNMHELLIEVRAVHERPTVYFTLCIGRQCGQDDNLLWYHI